MFRFMYPKPHTTGLHADASCTGNPADNQEYGFPYPDVFGFAESDRLEGSRGVPASEAGEHLFHIHLEKLNILVCGGFVGGAVSTT